MLEDWTYRQFLEVLLSEEIAHRSQTRLGRVSRRAGFPFLKTIDEFDFTEDFVAAGHLEVLWLFKFQQRNGQEVPAKPETLSFKTARGQLKLTELTTEAKLLFAPPSKHAPKPSPSPAPAPGAAGDTDLALYSPYEWKTRLPPAKVAIWTSLDDSASSADPRSHVFLAVNQKSGEECLALVLPTDDGVIGGLTFTRDFIDRVASPAVRKQYGSMFDGIVKVPRVRNIVKPAAAPKRKVKAGKRGARPR